MDEATKEQLKAIKTELATLRPSEAGLDTKASFEHVLSTLDAFITRGHEQGIYTDKTLCVLEETRQTFANLSTGDNSALDAHKARRPNDKTLTMAAEGHIQNHMDGRLQTVDCTPQEKPFVMQKQAEQDIDLAMLAQDLDKQTMPNLEHKTALPNNNASKSQEPSRMA